MSLQETAAALEPLPERLELARSEAAEAAESLAALQERREAMSSELEEGSAALTSRLAAYEARACSARPPSELARALSSLAPHSCP